MGRPGGSFPPPNIDHLFRDPDKPLPVILLIVPSDDPKATPKDSHWQIYWTVFQDPQQRVVRKVHITRELNCAHLTNWGPITATAEEQTNRCPEFELGNMTLAQRTELEKIASETEVEVPNGEWNCQNWIVEVLNEAIAVGLFSTAQVSKVLHEAAVLA